MKSEKLAFEICRSMYDGEPDAEAFYPYIDES
jgi:hypothetical protein